MYIDFFYHFCVCVVFMHKCVNVPSHVYECRGACACHSLRWLLRFFPGYFLLTLFEVESLT